eukprot:Selendium_serpulae@DN6171_c0_g1_i2.p1
MLLFIAVVVAVICVLLSPPLWRTVIRIASFFTPPETYPRLYVSTSNGFLKQYDVIVVGAGCAGCTLSILLGRRGMKVLLLDRDFDMQHKVPKIIGEYMQPGGMEKLYKFGLADCALEADSCPSVGYSMFNPKKGADGKMGFEEVLIRYPSRRPRTLNEQLGLGMKTRDLELEETTDVLPPNAATMGEEKLVAWGFHYDAFIKNLRNKCKEIPNITCFNATVNELQESEMKVVGVSYTEKAGNKDVAHAALTVLCDGGANPKWRKTMGMIKPPSILSTWVGVSLKHDKWKPPLIRPAHGNLVLTYPSPVLFYQNSPTETRLLVCVDDYSKALEHPAPDDKVLKECYDESGILDHMRYLKTVVAPQLPPVMAAALDKAVNSEPADPPTAGSDSNSPSTAASENPVDTADTGKESKSILIAKNCYSVQIPQTWNKEGLIAVGDAFSTRHAVTGGGMLVTLNDVDILHQIILGTNIAHPTASKTIMERLAKNRRESSGTVNVLANALHQVLCVPPGPQKHVRSILRDACFNYIGKNEFNKCGTLALISGMSPRSVVLLYHLFSVAGDAMRDIAVAGSPEPKKICTDLFHLLKQTVSIIMPHVTRENCSILATWPCQRGLDLLFDWEKQAREILEGF